MENQNQDNVNETPTEGQTQNTEDERVTLTQKEIQSIIDKRVTQAVQTTKQKENEEKLLAEKKWKDLYQIKENELQQIAKQKEELELSQRTIEELNKLGLTDLTEYYKFDTKTLNGRVDFAKKLKEYINGEVQKGIKSSLNTNTNPNSSTASIQQTWVGKDPTQWTKEDLLNFKKFKNIKGGIN